MTEQAAPEQRSFSEVPVIDVAALRGDDGTAYAKVVAEIGRAAEEVGFFYIVGTGIAPQLFPALFAQTKAFFAKGIDEKMQNYIGLSRCHRGYVPEGEEGYENGKVDRKEAFDCGPELPADDPDHLIGNRFLGPNQWPAQAGFADAVTEYYEAILQIGKTLFRAFAVALGEPADLFEAQAQKAPSQLRLMHYRHDEDAVDVLGIGAHTDFECFTLLKPTAPGLEVLNGAGQWIDVPPLPDAFVVNIGDMLEVWTNGQFVATTHRVRKVKEERYSFPLFFSADFDTVIKPLSRFVSDDRPAMQPVVAGEHLFAQTIHGFHYLREQVKRGELALPDGARAPDSFGQGARQPKPD
jgi:isopenicillin N synthase-like dioxygenase